ncbi:hypothetical protein Ddc_04712 [Ditylenchus destructor]|nr:hypothetical protein Ddc_04712 [Ditylenchus destructor]
MQTPTDKSSNKRYSPDHKRHNHATTRDRKRHSSPTKKKPSYDDISEIPLPRSHHTNRSPTKKSAHESSPRHSPRRSSPKSSKRGVALNQLAAEFSKSGISSYRYGGRTTRDSSPKRSKRELSVNRPVRETFGNTSFSKSSTDRYRFNHSKDDYTSNKSSRVSSPKRYGSRTSPKTGGFSSDYQKRDRYHVRSSSDMSISPTHGQKSNNRTDGKNPARILRKAINALSPDKSNRTSPQKLSSLSNSDDFSSHDQSRNGSSNIDFRPNSGFKPNQFGRKWSPDKFNREPSPEKASLRPSTIRYGPALPPNRHSHEGLPYTHVSRRTDGFTPEQASSGLTYSRSTEARTLNIDQRDPDTHLVSSSRSYQRSSPNYSTGEISYHRLSGRTPNRDTPDPLTDKRGPSANKPDQGFGRRFIGAWTPNADHQEQSPKRTYSRPLKGKSPNRVDAPLYSRPVGVTPSQDTYEPPPKTAMDLETPNTHSYQLSSNRTTGERNPNQYSHEPSPNHQIAGQTPNTFFGRTSFTGHIPETVYDVRPGECTPNYATRETPLISRPIGVKSHNPTFPPAYYTDGYRFVRPPGTTAPNFSTNETLPIDSMPLNIPMNGQSPGMPPLSRYTVGTTPNRASHNQLPVQLMRASTPDRPIYGASPNRAPSGLPFTSSDRGRTPDKPIRGPDRMRVLQARLSSTPSGLPFTPSDRGRTPDKPVRGQSPNRPFTESDRMRVLQARLSKLNYFGPKVEKHWKIMSEKASILETIAAALQKKGILLKEGRKLDKDILNISYGKK